MKKLIILSVVVLTISSVFASSFARHVLWQSRGEIILGTTANGDDCSLLISEGKKDQFGSTILDIELDLNNSKKVITDDGYMAGDASLNILSKEWTNNDVESRLEIHVGDAQSGDIVKTKYFENGKVVEECRF